MKRSKKVQRALCPSCGLMLGMDQIAVVKAGDATIMYHEVCHWKQLWDQERAHLVAANDRIAHLDRRVCALTVALLTTATALRNRWREAM